MAIPALEELNMEDLTVAQQYLDFDFLPRQLHDPSRFVCELAMPS